MATPGTASEADLPPFTQTSRDGLSPGPGGSNKNVLNVSHEGEHHSDYGGFQITTTRHNYIYAFCAAVNSCNLGYDIGVSTEAGQLVEKEMNLTTEQREIFLGSINFWAIFGGLFASYFSDRFGRRRTFIVAAIGFILGVIVMAASRNFNTLMFGRFLVGLGVGTGLAIDPLYIAEITPAKHRGELVTWSEIAINVGIVLGFVSGLVFSGLSEHVQWRAMFGMGAILPTIMIFLVIFILPESPRWLVANGQDQAAKEVLQLVYPPGFDVDLVINDIKEALERETSAEHGMGWNVFYNPTPAFQRMIFVGVGTAIAQQAVGIDAIQYYLLDVIEQSGVESKTNRQLILIVLGIIKLLCVFVGAKMFDRRGRRPLFFASLIGMALALLLVSFSFAVSKGGAKAFAVVGLAAYLAFFSIGMGPGAWLIPSEIFATCIRAKAMSVATFSNRIVATLMASTSLTTAIAMGWSAFFFMMSIVCMIVCAFIYFYLPETKGRSLEDMSIYFAEITNDRSILEAEAEIIKRREKTPGTSADQIEMSKSPSANII